MIQTGIGPVAVSRVKIRDRGAASDDDRVRFFSPILPKWARRTPSCRSFSRGGSSFSSLVEAPLRFYAVFRGSPSQTVAAHPWETYAAGSIYPGTLTI